MCQHGFTPSPKLDAETCQLFVQSDPSEMDTKRVSVGPTGNTLVVMVMNGRAGPPRSKVKKTAWPFLDWTPV